MKWTCVDAGFIAPVLGNDGGFERLKELAVCNREQLANVTEKKGGRGYTQDKNIKKKPQNFKLKLKL